VSVNWVFTQIIAITIIINIAKVMIEKPFVSRTFRAKTVAISITGSRVPETTASKLKLRQKESNFTQSLLGGQLFPPVSIDQLFTPLTWA